MLELQERTISERQSVLKDAELDRYRAERNRWEVRELWLVEQLETTRRELDKRGLGVDGEVVTTLPYKELIVQLQGERDTAYGEVEKLRGELASLKARMRQLEESAGSGQEGGTGGTVRTDRAPSEIPKGSGHAVLRADAPAFAPTI